MIQHEPTAAQLLEIIIEAVRAGQERLAVRIAIETTDTWMHAGSWDTCNEALRLARPESLGTTASLGLLTALDPARDQTTGTRLEFVARFRRYLEAARPGEADELMRGLE